MALNYSDVSAGDTILAAHPNALLDDIEQHDHDGSDTNGVLVPLQVTITPGGAVVALTIDQNFNAIGLNIDSEATGNYALQVAGKGIYFTQDVFAGIGFTMYRNTNDAGVGSLVKFIEDHNGGDEAVLEIQNDGSGEEIKFTNPVTRYISIPGADFHANDGVNQTNFLGIQGSLQDVDGAFGVKNWFIGINVPHGAIITSLKMYYRQRDNVAELFLELRRSDFAGTQITMARCDDQNIADSYGSNEDNTIASATVNNSAYCYYLFAQMDNNDATNDMFLEGAVITYTIAEPLP